MKRALIPILLLVFFFVLLGASFSSRAQDITTDKIISRIPNRARIARAWNSLGPATLEWNESMEKADALIHERFDPRIVVVNPDDKRIQQVAHYKTAREALLKQLDALNELIDEEDY
jgi:hypothetical protein